MKLTIRVKLMAGFLAIVAMLAVVAVVGVRGMQGIDQDLDELFEEDFKLVEAVDDVFIESLEAEVLLLEVAEADDEAIRERHIAELNDQVALVEEHLEHIGTLTRNAEEREFLARIEDDFFQFEAEIVEVEHLVEIGDHAGVVHAIETEVNPTFADLKIAIGDFIHEVEADAEAKKLHADESAASSTQLIIIIGLVAAALSLAVAWLLSSSMSKNIRLAADSVEAISVGDLSKNVQIKSSDETGDLGASMQRMEIYLKDSAAYAQSIAEGDLTIDVEPRPSEDVLGNAFKAMVQNLREIVGQVSDASESVGESSEQLTQLSAQAGQATQQVATTIQDVASGTSAASESLQGAAEGVSQLSDATDGVAKGAQAQARQIQETQATLGQMVSSIDQVSENARSVVSASDDAKAAADSGAEAVDRTVDRMNAISETVSSAAAKVRQLGVRSEEIGNIVGVINDIADQTNLLALNAAIQAARAGEMGRGFAVVAEEVRKLAERTSSATDEITGLIKAVQEGTAEAVTGIEAGAEEVVAGTEVAAEAGKALGDIQSAVASTAAQIAVIATAADGLAKNSSEVDRAMTSVMTVAEGSSAAAEEMTGRAGEVSTSIESVSSVSEENSAAAEEVSASTEEMNAQIEEMAASAGELSRLSNVLGDSVARFNLGDDEKIPATTSTPAAVSANGDETTNGVTHFAPVPVEVQPEI